MVVVVVVGVVVRKGVVVVVEHPSSVLKVIHPQQLPGGPLQRLVLHTSFTIVGTPFVGHPQGTVEVMYGQLGTPIVVVDTQLSGD